MSARSSIALADAPAQPPENMAAEQALLGVFLGNNDALAQVPAHFRAAHFYAPLHQRLYAAIREAWGVGRAATPITLKGAFEQDSGMAAVGGVSYLVRLVAGAFVPSVPDYCECLIGAWMRRELMEAFGQALHALAGESEAPAEVAARAGAAALEIVSSASRRHVETDFEVGTRILDKLKHPARRDSTGLARLDKAMGGGLYARKLYGFAARKKIGKTVMAGTLSANLADQGVPHLFVCAEMSSEEVMQRMLARRTDSFESAFRSSYGKSRDFEDKLAAVVAQSSRRIFFEDKPGIAFAELQQVIATHVMRNGIKGFIIDYWQLVGGKPAAKNAVEHLDEVAQWLAGACRKYDVWGVVMAQINQEGNTRGGEGLRLACDQLYELRREPVTQPQAWLEMMETRYTPWANVGDEIVPGLMMNEKGPFFEEFAG